MDTCCKNEHCQVCQERGWLLVSNDRHGLRIERCDTCSKFQCDEHAGTAAWPVLSKATEALSLCMEVMTWMKDSLQDKDRPAALVERLRALCNPVKQPADEPEPDQHHHTGSFPGKNVNTDQDSFPKVILSVSGGVADVIFKPAGIMVTILDYDVDDIDKPQKDPDGENCMISNWPVQDTVIGNAHWPIVQQAKRDATCRCVRKWKCPSCAGVREHSYEVIVEVGRPYCRDCEIEMAMI